MLGQKKSHTASSHTRTLRKACRQISLTRLGRKERHTSHTRALRKTWKHIFLAIVGVLMLTNPAHSMNKDELKKIQLLQTKIIELRDVINDLERRQCTTYGTKTPMVNEVECAELKFNKIDMEELETELAGKKDELEEMKAKLLILRLEKEELPLGATASNPAPSDPNPQPRSTATSFSRATTYAGNLPGGYRAGDVVRCRGIKRGAADAHEIRTPNDIDGGRVSAFVFGEVLGEGIAVDRDDDGNRVRLVAVNFGFCGYIWHVHPRYITLPEGYRPEDVVYITGTNGNVEQCVVKHSSPHFETHLLVQYPDGRVCEPSFQNITPLGGFKRDEKVWLTCALDNAKELSDDANAKNKLSKWSAGSIVGYNMVDRESDDVVFFVKIKNVEYKVSADCITRDKPSFIERYF